MAEVVKRKITESVKKSIAGKQNFKCKANINDYDCPLYFNGRDGTFDEAGYEIDHIEEFSIEGNEELNNLQALCPMCHRVKTKRFNQQKKKDKPKTSSKYDIEIILFNNEKINVRKINLKQFKDKESFIDCDKNIYQIKNFNKYRKIGIYDKNKFTHIFELIEKPPKRSRTFQPFLLDEEQAIRNWSSKYGFSYDEYNKYYESDINICFV